MSIENKVQEKMIELVKLIEEEAEERARKKMLQSVYAVLDTPMVKLTPKPSTTGTAKAPPRRRRTSIRKPGGFGAMTGAILETLKTAPAAGIRAREVILRVRKLLPESESHTIGVMLSNLRSRGRIIKRGQKPNSMYSLPKG